MLKNRNIVCISSIDWDFIWQGPQEIMSMLAKNGNRVLFIENMGVRTPNLQDIPRIKKRIRNWFKGVKGIRKVSDNLYVLSPLVFPFPYSRLFGKINKMILFPIINTWIKTFNFYSPITWIFLPTNISLDLSKALNSDITIYYCVDRFAYSSGLAKKIKKSEMRVIEQSDLVFTSTQYLAKDLLPYRSDVHIFYFGVNTENFEKIRDSQSEIPDDIRRIKHPIIGYMGGVHKWIDFELIKFVAETHPDYSIVFVGPVQTDVAMFSGLKNVYFLGQKDYNEIPLYIKAFDVGIIPYVLTEYTKVGRPTKLNEYLIMAKPVVSTEMPEVVIFSRQFTNSVLIGRNKEEFAGCIEKALREKNIEAEQIRIQVAKKNAWESKIEEMSNLIDETIEKKKEENALEWQDVFVRFYRSAKKKLVRVGAVALVLYFIIFYTPFIFWLAKPLKISDAPQKADAIVVFAGGVGESGKAEQGYGERVKYAVDLYKKGYAKYIIFSSGYVYVFEEPVVMKLLAISLGVPQEAIILEDKAKNTYENVKFSKEILHRNGWSKILLVSSPYHMRRASLVFNKIAREIKVNYAPIPRSLFYSHREILPNGKRSLKEASLQQLQGILHEYLGIVYYWWKGYI